MFKETSTGTFITDMNSFTDMNILFVRKKQVIGIKQEMTQIFIKK